MKGISDFSSNVKKDINNQASGVDNGLSFTIKSDSEMSEMK